MAITTYSELKTAVENWLDHQLFTSRVPEFIALFEAVANRRLRVRQQETSTTLTPSSGDASLPSDYLSWRSVLSGADSGRELQYVTPVYMNLRYSSSDTDVPSVFTIVGSTLKIRPIDSSDLTLVYYAKVPALSDSATTNWLLTAHPDLYLFGSLVEAEVFGVNDERLSMWKARRDEIFTEIELLANRSKGVGQLRVDYPTP